MVEDSTIDAFVRWSESGNSFLGKIIIKTNIVGYLLKYNIQS